MNGAAQPAQNTDRELYREPAEKPWLDGYQPSVHVTADGLIGMNVGGYVVVQSITDWHTGALTPYPDPPSEPLSPGADGAT